VGQPFPKQALSTSLQNLEKVRQLSNTLKDFSLGIEFTWWVVLPAL
jgi:hypothetical protein